MSHKSNQVITSTNQFSHLALRHGLLGLEQPRQRDADAEGALPPVVHKEGGVPPGKGLLGLTVRGPDGLAKPTVRQSAIRNAFTLLTTLVHEIYTHVPAFPRPGSTRHVTAPTAPEDCGTGASIR